MSYFQETSAQAARQRENPHPTLTLPLTPPTTPPSAPRSAYANMSKSTATGGEAASHRHAYNASTPSLSIDSPSRFDLPPLMRDDSDEEGTPSTSQAITPPGSMSSLPYPRIEGEYPSPIVLDDAFDDRFSKPSYPSVPSRTPRNLEASPPQTPKGHPLTEKRSWLEKKQLYSIVNPYSSTARKYTTTLGYLLRVPRKFRPLIMLAFCVISFIFVYLSRANAHSAHLAAQAQERAMQIGRRYIEAVAEMPHTLAAQTIPEGAVTKFANTQEEFGALISFITSTVSNSLPPLDPLQPLDPGAMLDFDPLSAGARDDLDLLIQEVHALYPLVLMGKMRDPWHREIKKMLSEYKIVPSPLIIDVDQRRDHLLFIPLISRLLKTTELPQLLLQGKPLGSYHDILAMKDKGTLVKTLEANKAVSIKLATKKKKALAEAMRLENERILKPQPIVDE